MGEVEIGVLKARDIAKNAKYFEFVRHTLMEKMGAANEQKEKEITEKRAKELARKEKKKGAAKKGALNTTGTSDTSGSGKHRPPYRKLPGDRLRTRKTQRAVAWSEVGVKAMREG